MSVTLNPTDMYIPLIMCGKILDGKEKVINDANITDVAPTVASILGFPFGKSDGHSLRKEFKNAADIHYFNKKNNFRDVQ